MKMKKLGRTGLMVTENSFGALPIQRIDQKSAVELLHMAYDAGINYYDTARAYTDSEEKLGAAFHDRRSSIVISTKSQGKTKQQVLDDLDTSLKNLRTDYVDILQLHNIASLPDPQDPDGIHAALEEARKQGKCRFIGITSHRRPVAEAAAKSGLYDTVQFPVSHISPQEDIDLIDLCGKLDVGFIAMKALSGPFGGIKFIPTGGVNAQNVGEYISAPFIHAVGGSWVCPKADIAAGNFEKITALCAESRRNLLGYEVAHVGINTKDNDAAQDVANTFGAAFGFAAKGGNSSVFASTSIEVMKSQYLGKQGHLAVRANQIDIAVADLKKGFQVDMETAKYKGDRMIAVYLKNEIGGFAIHLLQK